jgi:glycosyltransferase involved in cell wall biosynthesis
LFRKVDVVVSASIRESFGRALVEAMACGVPVVATRSGGPEEIIVDAQTGFLVAVADDAVLAERVAQLLDDRALAAEIGSAARAHVRESFSLDATVGGVVISFEHALVATQSSV